MLLKYKGDGLFPSMEMVSALLGAPMVTEAAAAHIEAGIFASWGMVRRQAAGSAGINIAINTLAFGGRGVSWCRNPILKDANFARLKHQCENAKIYYH